MSLAVTLNKALAVIRSDDLETLGSWEIGQLRRAIASTLALFQHCMVPGRKLKVVNDER